MIKINVITGFPNDSQKPFRLLSDLMPYQDNGVEISLSHNSIGPISCNNDIEHALGIAGMAAEAIRAEEAGSDAIVIESMGDTGLIPCREAVTIPVIGFADTAIRVAQMLGRRFGIITVGAWQGFALERILQSYGLMHQYIGFEALGVQPFFTDVSEDELERRLLKASIKLMQNNVDTIVLGGSYFIGKSSQLIKALSENNYPDSVIIDPFPLAIRFARMLVECNLSHSKRIYANPIFNTNIQGYPSITRVPGLKNHL